MDDLVRTGTLRAEFERRIESLNTLKNEFMNSEVEHRKVAKAEDDARKEDVRGPPYPTCLRSATGVFSVRTAVSVDLTLLVLLPR
jgi:hypothetical protein